MQNSGNQRFRLFRFTFNSSLLTLHFWRSQSGQSLIEIIIAIALAGVLLPALLTGLVSSREGKAQEGQRLAATALLRESEEAVRSVREKGWANISTNGTYDVQISGSEWALTTCPCPPVNGFSRQVVIADAQRDSSGNIIDSGGTLDPSTKKIETTVSWTTPSSSSLQTISYLQRYLGNSAFTHTTQAEFAAGSHNNTQAVSTGGGAVELTQSVGGAVDYGNKFRVTATSAIGNMTSINHKTSLRFTAQESKTVNAVRVYLQSENGSSPAYRYGIQTNNPTGNVPSGIWVGNFGTLTTTSAGWKAVNLGTPASLTAGTIYHLVVEPSGTPSGGSNIGLRRSSPLNNLYPQTNAADSNANTLFKTSVAGAWVVQGFQPIYELDFSDATFEGNPYISYNEISVFGANWYGERFSFTGADKNANSISFYVRRNGNPPANLNVQIRRVSDNGIVYTGTLATPSIPTSYSLQTHTISPSPITLTAGTAYRVIIQTTGGSGGNSYRFHRLNTTNSANYNSISYDGTNSTYTASTNSGSTWTDTNNWDVGGFYFSVAGTSTYSANGTFESHTAGSFDAGTPAAFNNITWTANVPANTTIQLQAAISNNSGGPWDFFGSDGISGSFFSSSGPIPLNRINGRYLRYRATFSSDGSVTPSLNDVSINYSP